MVNIVEAKRASAIVAARLLVAAYVRVWGMRRLSSAAGRMRAEIARRVR